MNETNESGEQALPQGNKWFSWVWWGLGLFLLGILLFVFLIRELGGMRFSVPVAESVDARFQVDSIALNRVRVKDIEVDSTMGSARIGSVQTSVEWAHLWKPRLDQIVVRDWSVTIPLAMIRAAGESEERTLVGERAPVILKGDDSEKLTLPFQELLLEEGDIVFERPDQSVFRLTGEAQIKDENASILGTVRAVNKGVTLNASLKMLPEGNWSAQIGINVLELLDQYTFFQETLELPALPSDLVIDDMGPIKAEGLLTSWGESLEQSWLADGGYLHLGWDDRAHLVVESWVGGVTLEDARIGQVEVGVNVRRLEWDGFEAERFQLSGSQSEDGKWSAELPSFNWKKGTDLGGEFAGRIFAEKRGEGIENIDAEVQLAIQRLQWSDYGLEPFRLFGDLDQGILQVKLSPLIIGRWSDWRLANGALQWNQIEHYGRLSGALEYDPESRGVLDFSIEIEKSLEDEWSARGQITGEIDERLADFELTQSAAGQIKGSARGEWNMADTWLYMELFSQEAFRIESGGVLKWSNQISGKSDEALAMDFEVSIENGALIHLALDKWAVHDINTTLRGRWDEGLSTEGLQTIRIGQLRFGEHELKDLVISFWAEETEYFKIESIEAGWLGGKLRVGSFEVNPLDPDFSTQIYFEGIDAELLMAQFSEFKMRIVGQMDGSVPFSYRKGQVLPQRGHLRARATPQAMLFFEDEEQIAQYLRLPNTFDMKEKAMQAIMGGIEIKSFVIDLFNPETPLQPILMDVKGALKTKDIDLQGLNIRVPVRVDSADYMKDLQFLLGLFTGG